MADLATRFQGVHVDVGTGDGSFVLRLARAHPERLVIGVDANVTNLRDAARKAAGKPARGGAPNALFGRLPLEEAPGELAGLAGALTVLLPWGTLLRAVAAPDPAALARLGALGAPGAELRVVFGYGPATEARAIEELGLPALEDPALPARLAGAYREAGFAVTVRALALEEVRALPTTWAKKLAFSGHRRLFVEVTGRVVK